MIGDRCSRKSMASPGVGAHSEGLTEGRYSWSLKEQRQQGQPISLCPELVGVLREAWPIGSLNTSVQRIRHSHRPAAFSPHCSSVTGGHSSGPEEPCSGCTQNGRGLFFKAEIPRKEHNVLLKSAISLSLSLTVYLQPGKAWFLLTVESVCLCCHLSSALSLKYRFSFT